MDEKEKAAEIMACINNGEEFFDAYSTIESLFIVIEAIKAHATDLGNEVVVEHIRGLALELTTPEEGH